MRISLSALHAFEAAARLGSFKTAAEELNLSPSAVSHAIAKLERELGTLLFDREGRRLSLTGDGQSLHAPVEEAFGLINSGMNAISMRQTSVLRLHAAPSFAAQWLMPRLASFRADNPLIEVQIAADTDYVRFTGDDFDADIVYGMRSQEALMTNPLGRELIAPMCSPELAPAIRSAADLVGLPLIHSTLKYTTWADWLGANGIAPPAAPGMRFDRSFMAINAAVEGLGVCLDSTRLAERDLKSGRLVLPLAGKSYELYETHHFLVYPKRNEYRPVLKTFARWLMAELARD